MATVKPYSIHSPEMLREQHELREAMSSDIFTSTTDNPDGEKYATMKHLDNLSRMCNYNDVTQARNQELQDKRIEELIARLDMVVLGVTCSVIALLIVAIFIVK